MNDMNQYYPIFLNVKAMKVTVIGGGLIALRKVKDLLKQSADVTVISPDICKGIEDLFEQGKIQVLKRKYRSGDLDGLYLAVVAAGNKGVNNRVVKEAAVKKVLLNIVDDPGLSDFIVPSVVHRGDISVAVSTGGKSPALARKIRAGLENYFAEEYSTVALLVNEVRTELRQKGTKFSRAAWQNALDLDRMIDLLKKKERMKAKSLLLENLNKSKPRK
jgi:precorrin-2 dehydrogenase / sirohydrochlorin ferrochelatase